MLENWSRGQFLLEANPDVVQRAGNIGYTGSEGLFVRTLPKVQLWDSEGLSLEWLVLFILNVCSFEHHFAGTRCTMSNSTQAPMVGSIHWR